MEVSQEEILVGVEDLAEGPQIPLLSVSAESLGINLFSSWLDVILACSFLFKPYYDVQSQLDYEVIDKPGDELLNF